MLLFVPLDFGFSSWSRPTTQDHLSPLKQVCSALFGDHVTTLNILAVGKAGHLIIKAKMLHFEAHVLIGWLSQNIR